MRNNPLIFLQVDMYRANVNILFDIAMDLCYSIYEVISMKNYKIGEKVIVNLGKKFGNTRVLATYEGSHEEDKKLSIIKPFKVLVSKEPNYILSTLLKTMLIVDNTQILC